MGHRKRSDNAVAAGSRQFIQTTQPAILRFVRLNLLSLRVVTYLRSGRHYPTMKCVANVAHGFNNGNIVQSCKEAEARQPGEGDDSSLIRLRRHGPSIGLPGPFWTFREDGRT